MKANTTNKKKSFTGRKVFFWMSLWIVDIALGISAQYFLFGGMFLVSSGAGEVINWPTVLVGAALIVWVYFSAFLYNWIMYDLIGRKAGIKPAAHLLPTLFLWAIFIFTTFNIAMNKI